jgi:hypothetical protein
MALTPSHVKSTRWDLNEFFSRKSHRVDFPKKIGFSVAIHFDFMSFTEVIRSPLLLRARVLGIFGAEGTGVAEGCCRRFLSNFLLFL